jgi:hypothetical protein
MNDFHNRLSIVFQKISEAIESLSEEDTRRLSDPQYVVELKIARYRAREGKFEVPNDYLAEEAITAITSLSNRQEAKSLLDDKFGSKKALEALARRLDIPINKKDKIEELRDKIVEATVGARMRSQAIQGTNLPES